MKQNELLRKIAETSGLNQSESKLALDAITSIITKSLEADTSISIPNLGTFSLATRKARKGHNPMTGSSIDIPAMRTAKFKPTAGIKRLVKNIGL